MNSVNLNKNSEEIPLRVELKDQNNVTVRKSKSSRQPLGVELKDQNVTTRKSTLIKNINNLKNSKNNTTDKENQLNSRSKRLNDPDISEQKN